MRPPSTLIIFVLLFSSLGSFSQDLPLHEVEQVRMPEQNNKELMKAELEAREIGRPNHFAVAIPVDISPETHGDWTIENGQATWKLRVFSRNAKSLNLGFSRFYIPESAELHIYSPDQSTGYPIFTAENMDDHGELWTPIVRGKETVLEIRIDENEISELDLKLSFVNHDFQGFGQTTSAALSGACNLDVVCDESDGWEEVNPHRDIIQSVGVYSLGGVLSCTGSLINNTDDDCTPYFLTANHCGITSGNASSVIVYWNYENSECRQPGSAESGQEGDGSLNDFNSGAMLRANYAESDMTLIELDDEVSESADAYMAGWSREDEAFDTAIAIHHPNTDEKRISFEYDPGIIAGYLDDTPNQSEDHIRVEDWDIGTTEPGSSGSPLFNQDERIIGQLHGGYAACGNNDADWYGWFRTSWEGGGTPSSRLKDWLDPGNTGVMVLDGKSCAYSLTASENLQEVCAPEDAVYELTAGGSFSGPVNLSVNNLPAGASSSFSTNPVSPGESTILTVTNTEDVGEGSHSFSVTGTNAGDEGSSSLTLIVADAAPSAPNLEEPANGENEIPTVAVLSWEDIGGATYTVGLAEDESFNSIVETASELTANSYDVNTLLELNTTYYWRVTAENVCGESEWSEVFSFTTSENTSCGQFTSEDLPVNISQGAGASYDVEVDVPFSGSIIDVNIPTIAGDHTWISDLTFSLTSPEGTTVILLSEECNDEQGFDIGFDDDATGVFPCPFNDGGIYPPAQALSAFSGENPQGTWVLTVTDAAFLDGGEIQQVELEVCASGDVGLRESSSTDFSLYPNPTNGEFILTASKPFTENTAVEILNIDGKVIHRKVLNGGNTRTKLTLANVSSGIYIVRFISGKNISHKRLIKQ